MGGWGTNDEAVAAGGAAGDTPSILVVCSGNICRSPLAEQLLRARLGAATERVVVASAGTIAYDGAAMDERAAALSLRYGGDPAGHRSRMLNERQILGAALVLTASRDHRAEVVSLVPRASRYAFTLRQFAGLLAQIGDEELRQVRDLPALVEAAAAHRGFALPAGSPDADDIEDPYRQHDEVYERVGQQIDELVDEIASRLRVVLS